MNKINLSQWKMGRVESTRDGRRARYIRRDTARGVDWFWFSVEGHGEVRDRRDGTCSSVPGCVSALDLTCKPIAPKTPADEIRGARRELRESVEAAQLVFFHKTGVGTKVRVEFCIEDESTPENRQEG
jgi:hypothetical protein